MAPRNQLSEAFQLAVQYHQSGQLPEAERLYRSILSQQPDHTDALHNLGLIAARMGRHDAAAALIERAIALQPDAPDAYYNLAMALKAIGRLDEAVAAYRKALALDPAFLEAQSNLGIALQANGQLEEAVTAFRQAIDLEPGRSAPRNNLGVALMELGELDDAIAVYRQAILVNPDDANAHKNLALALLTREEFSEGWEEYEWRWKCPECKHSRRNFPQPLWDGRSFGGQKILLHAEQGFGDTLQFIRYLPSVAGLGGQVIVECQPELCRLIGQMAGAFSVVGRREPLPSFDLHCPLLSLPRAFATVLSTAPRQVPYLHAAPQAVRHWSQRLAEDSSRLKVGLAWSGSSSNTTNTAKSVSFNELAPLFRLSGVKFYSLQKGPRVDPPGNATIKPELTDWTDELHDFADTAALISNLDLVISVDTAIAHLAGALGKPVWTLLRFAADWRWFRGRQESPWYPTMKLFRQSKRGDWESVIRRVAEALSFSQDVCDVARNGIGP